MDTGHFLRLGLCRTCALNPNYNNNNNNSNNNKNNNFIKQNRKKPQASMYSTLGREYRKETHSKRKTIFLIFLETA